MEPDADGDVDVFETTTIEPGDAIGEQGMRGGHCGARR